jgi:DNA-binding response OmpR family regulator
VLHVVVVEDEPSIRQGLCDVLTFRGYRVTAASDGRAGLERCLTAEPDLIVLDVMMPELDGYSVCRTLRERNVQAPVLMLTAKNSEDDVLSGFDAGADDYVTKPFSVRQFLARVQALLRRSSKAATESFQVGRFEVNPEHGLATDGTRKVELSLKELQILRVLAEEPGRIVSRRTLLREVWGMNNVNDVETRTVDVHVAKLRRKLGEAESQLETVRGQGYRICSKGR